MTICILYPQVEAIVSQSRRLWREEEKKIPETQKEKLFVIASDITANRRTQHGTKPLLFAVKKWIGNNTMAGYYKQGSRSWHTVKDRMMKCWITTSRLQLFGKLDPPPPHCSFFSCLSLFFIFFCDGCIELWSANKWNFNLSWTSVTKAVGRGRN